MKVFVVNKYGRPLMPTTPRKARILLGKGSSKIVKRTPFTIQLIYSSSGYLQQVKAGIDSGYKYIGFSAIDEQKELIGGEVKLIKGISERLTERAKYRRQRRNRKRYRQPRFDNRKKSKQPGWLAPSVKHKLHTHKKVIEMLKAVLPISSLTIEVADFDIQKLKNPDIQGVEYQQGEQYGFIHLRQYILHRDRHNCQNPNCKNKSKEPILQVHHLGYWKKDRADRPSNLITLCSKCHVSKNHKENGFLYGWQPKIKSFRPETFMSTVKWRLKKFADSITYGCITKLKRNSQGLEKSHHNDAFVIGGGAKQKRCYTQIVEQIRRHKRSMEQFYDAKYFDIRTGKKVTGSELHRGGRTRNKNHFDENLRIYRGHKLSQGQRRIKTRRYPYSQGDLVMFEGKIFAVIGMQNKGKGLKIANYPGVKNKVVKPSLVKSIQKRGGLCYAI